MVKVEIIGPPARQGEYVVGTIRFLSEADANLGEYPFRERLEDLATLTTEEFTAHAVKKMKAKLKAERIEANWGKVQEILKPLEVEIEE